MRDGVAVQGGRSSWTEREPERSARQGRERLAGEDGAPYVERLHAIALGDNARLAIVAMDVLLDRGYGKVRVDLEIGARRPTNK